MHSLCEAMARRSEEEMMIALLDCRRSFRVGPIPPTSRRNRPYINRDATLITGQPVVLEIRSA